MKYFIQGMAMLSDVIILLAVLGAFYGIAQTTNPILYIIIISILLFYTYKTWKRQGAFTAWTKKGRKKFYDNWDKVNKIDGN